MWKLAPPVGRHASVQRHGRLCRHRRRRRGAAVLQAVRLLTKRTSRVSRLSLVTLMGIMIVASSYLQQVFSFKLCACAYIKFWGQKVKCHGLRPLRGLET